MKSLFSSAHFFATETIEAMSDLTLDEKNALCPPKWTDIEGFDMTRGNLRKGSCSYRCAHCRKNDCKAVLKFARCPLTGDIDFENVRDEGKHTRACCVMNGINPSVI